MYTVEVVAESVFRQKISTIPYKVLTKWFSNGPARARYKCVEYVIERAKVQMFSLIILFCIVIILAFKDKSNIKTCSYFWHRLLFCSLSRFTISCWIHISEVGTYAELSCYFSWKPTGYCWLDLFISCWIHFIFPFSSNRLLLLLQALQKQGLAMTGEIIRMAKNDEWKPWL